MKQFAVLLTVFNRIDFTKKCLSQLEEAIALCPDCEFDIILTDDHSTDNTKEVIGKLFPSVKILDGTGDLFWCRGMINSWKYAEKSEKKYDGYFWLNNDSYIFPNSLISLINQSEEKNNKAVISGAFKSAATNRTTYGGRLKGQTVNLDPDGTLQKIEWMNGNLVFVPEYVYEKIGMLDSTFWHAIGDYDYGLRAIKQNLEVVLSKDYVGECEDHEKIEACYDKKNSLRKRFKNLYTPLGDDPFMRFSFLKRHYSLGKAIKSFTITHLFVLFPDLMKFYNNK
ncbi:MULTISPECIES: glycosyltransferase family 2 protein [Chryseobacterium]|uniref:glycosyltransferase family 2 protein n=1 Tax=Chryseobacterium TaxID=59732 RepID=UPI001297AD2C|nr:MULTISPECIES: glycosyltransferase [Chryseobacterium]MDR6923461.1 GT2 family glycosyltransferase [Chryseobacterium sp. 2987]